MAVSIVRDGGGSAPVRDRDGRAGVESISLVAPHGGALVQRVLSGEEEEAARARAARYPALPLSERSLSDVVCLGTGVYSPLTGFMTRQNYWRVLDDMRLAPEAVRGEAARKGSLPWSMPVTLPVPPDVAAGLRIGRSVRLIDGRQRLIGIMRVEDVFERDAEYEAMQVFRTTDAAHPGVADLYGQSRVLVGGDVTLLSGDGDEEAAVSHGEPASAGPAMRPLYSFTPAQTRAEFARRGWRRVVGFQTRNPVHRAHEYIQKCALEIVDGLLLHPLIGATKDDDVPAPIRLRSYETLLQNYYPEDRVLLAAFPAAMRYAGPREAVFHALCRKNYGCSHFIVGRDHAGVGNYYGTYDAQRIFDEFTPEELGITPLFFEHAFYCHRCGGMATTSTCAHGREERVTLSGTAVRRMLRDGELPPPEFTRPEVARVLAEALVASASE